MALEGNNQLESDNIEALRCILERQQLRTFTHEEASEIGRDLLSFFEALGDDPAPDLQQREYQHPERAEV